MVMPDATRRQVSVPNVFVNGRFFRQRISGVQRYARETILCLDELLANGPQENIHWTLLVPRGAPTPRFRHILVDRVMQIFGLMYPLPHSTTRSVVSPATAAAGFRDTESYSGRGGVQSDWDLSACR